MKITRLKINNFRGIKRAELQFPDHGVLIGDNNAGKSTILEAIDLVLGPDRLSRQSPINEHDFYIGQYTTVNFPDECTSSDLPETNSSIQTVSALSPSSAENNEEKQNPIIFIEATVAGLSNEQKARFFDNIEWWDESRKALHTEPPVEGVDRESVFEAIRVSFVGKYVEDEDDFEGKTYFSLSLEESENPRLFSRRDKHYCGFLFLRSLRTGRRALSLERGSLLDIILRLKEIRPRMWESTIRELSNFDVASDPDLEITGVLESINSALKKYVPEEWGVEPHLRVSAMTRDHLRNVITAFIATGVGEHSAPFYRQGTGTVNMLVLAMLSQIAEDKQNVIFAMEEPETAIPPYAQKRIVHEIRKLSTQSLFTSHSPYVLEEFDLDETIVLTRSNDGVLHQMSVVLPDSVKHKRYRQEFRTRFCEGLLARRILLVEGDSETTAFPVVARRLAECDPTNFASLESLGICTVNAGSDSQIADLGNLYRTLGKTVYGICDKQSPESEAKIEDRVDELFMHTETGFEDLVMKNTTLDALCRFANILEWPDHILQIHPDPLEEVDTALRRYFKWSKGNWGLADFLAQCDKDEIPQWLQETCKRIRSLVQQNPKSVSDENGNQYEVSGLDG